MAYSQPITQFDDEEQRKGIISKKENKNDRETQDALEVVSIYEEEKRQGKLHKLDSIDELFT